MSEETRKPNYVLRGMLAAILGIAAVLAAVTVAHYVHAFWSSFVCAVLLPVGCLSMFAAGVWAERIYPEHPRDGARR